MSPAHLLEVANGVWAIVSAYLVAFLAYHIVKVGRQRKVRWLDWSHIPLSLQLAIALLAISVGVMVTSAAVWWARFINGGTIDLGSLDTFSFLSGRVVAIAGFMCALRVVTRPMLGHWPWISAILWCSVYLMWSVASRF